MKATSDLEGHWNGQPITRSSSTGYKKLLCCFALLTIPVYLFFPNIRTSHHAFPPHLNTQRVCAQEKPLRPCHRGSLYRKLLDIYKTDEFSARAAELLGGAVRIQTEVYDNDADTSKPVDKDDKTWHVFNNFSSYLETSFPKTHSSEAIELEHVNTYALLYTWKGSNKDLKPLLLMAHQDVVPVAVDIRPQWKHPPFSGELDEDGWLWGRGSRDDKSGLIGVLSSVETLLEQGFQPQRTVILAFGFDEEISGKMGAKRIADHLEDKLGKNSIALIVDEGEGYAERSGRMFAIPGIGEKGYIDVKVSVKSPGGHSSVPPKHTSIGYLAKIIMTLEANPSPPHLSRESPIFDTYQCIASWASDIPAGLRSDILASRYDDGALARVEAKIFSGEDMEAAMTRALLSTTVAVDIVNGGIKANALPEEASAIVNHRISTDSSLAALQEHYKQLLSPLARKMGMSLKVFGNETVAAGPLDRVIEVSDAYLAPLEPAPKSPIDAEAYKLLSGTIRAAYEDANQDKDDNAVIVAPGMMSGNTDTRYFWNLTPNIYRYSHLGSHHIFNGVHTINEAVKLSGFVDMIGFFTHLILNADENAQL